MSFQLIAVVAAGLAALGAAASSPRPSVQSTTTTSVEFDLRGASELPQLRSLLVSRRGQLVAEYYARGVRPDAPANVKSASKSIISALVGIAIDRGAIKSVKEPIATWFPELRQDADRRKQSITLEDLLTMRAGLESTSGRNYGAWVRSAQLGALRAQTADGQRAGRGDGVQHRQLAPALGHPHEVNRRQHLAVRAGRIGRADRFPPGQAGRRIRRAIYFGGNEMLLAPKQMVAIGELYLNRGKSSGRQIVPASWVDDIVRAAHRPQRGIRSGSTDTAGGSRTSRHGKACFAWGYGGQYILVFRDLDLVVAATSSTTVSEERRGHRRRLLDLIDERVLRPAAERRR